MFPSTDRAAVNADALAARTRSMAHRLLSGAGSASLLAYRLSPDEFTASIAHGLTRSGQFVVAGRPDPSDPVTTVDAGEPIDVRVDLLKESPDPAVRLVAATVHALGVLRWLAPGEARRLYAWGELPREVADLVEDGRGRLGVIDIERVVLRDSLGVTPMDFEDLVGTIVNDRPQAFPGADDEWNAYDLVASVSETHLAEMCRSVDTGAIPGAICWRRPTMHTCDHTLGHVFLADIDSTGVTLMSVREDETLAAFAAFRRPATTLDDLAVQVSCLIEDSVPDSSPRL
ncbi:hypothetical protein JS278_00865 [Acidipropionibacterium virtanenii]|uniref:DUF2470 domain-containing protein n=2 Tax=Acidipropionibacterium virtanenii TaxID=2057246 RepID=A0A344US04_9ACTN|nr:hypothetical protein JS278_00865 [Acidipropionibacterium virtanenii]